MTFSGAVSFVAVFCVIAFNGAGAWRVLKDPVTLEPVDTKPPLVTSTTTLPPTTTETNGTKDCSCKLQNGQCVHHTSASCPHAHYPAPSSPQLCDGDEYVCCVPDNTQFTSPPTKCESRKGKCQNAADDRVECDGYYENNLCPGALNIQCCLPVCD